MERVLEGFGPVKAVGADRAIRPSRTWPYGRTCSVAGCATRLSIYNRTSTCSLHEEDRPFVVRGRRRSSAATTGLHDRWIA
jgi:hypothetical protein